MNETDMETFISQAITGYRWFVYNTENGHVLAQGFAKRKQTAQRQANEAVLLLRADLYGVGTL